MLTVIDEDYLFNLIKKQNFASVLHITNEDLKSIFSEDVINMIGILNPAILALREKGDTTVSRICSLASNSMEIASTSRRSET